MVLSIVAAASAPADESRAEESSPNEPDRKISHIRSLHASAIAHTSWAGWPADSTRKPGAFDEPVGGGGIQEASCPSPSSPLPPPTTLGQHGERDNFAADSLVGCLQISMSVPHHPGAVPHTYMPPKAGVAFLTRSPCPCHLQTAG